MQLETIKNLELDIILDHISNSCNSDISKARLNNSELIYNSTELKTRMYEISETKEIYQAEAGLPLWSFTDIREMLHKIEPIGSFLEIADCQAVQNLLDIGIELKHFFNKRIQIHHTTPQKLPHSTPEINSNTNDHPITKYIPEQYHNKGKQ